MSGVSRRALQIGPGDTVAVALTDLSVGDTVDIGGASVRLVDAIQRGHKFALAKHAKDDRVLKYGAPIGVATRPIEIGEHVHEHNIRTTLSGLSMYAYEPAPPTIASPAAGEFAGYCRADGRVGVRNEIWIIATVGCVANACIKIAAISNDRYAGRTDGVHAITHPFGCSQLGDDLESTRRILAGLACHPNAGGVLIVGLGCESNRIDGLLAAAPQLDRTRLRIVRAQSDEDEVEAGVAAIAALVERAEQDVRTPCPASDLVLGLKCGGSDGLSGLTANPLLGRLAERVVAAGGSAILTEIPEIFGAEQLLMARAVDERVFERIAALTNGFKSYFMAHNQPVHENPSPGNKDGGISTLEEKSLGAVQKAGGATVSDAIEYGDSIKTRGLTLLEAPGNDAVSGTALAAAGATLILFTTGRGTPLGFPAPTLKIASNSDLAKRKPRWIDFDAGAVLGDQTVEDVDAAFLRCVLETASGKPAANESNGERSIAIWKRGVTL